MFAWYRGEVVLPSQTFRKHNTCNEFYDIIHTMKLRQSFVLLIGFVAMVTAIFFVWVTLDTRCEIVAAQYLPMSEIAFDPTWEGACVTTTVGLLDRHIEATSCINTLLSEKCTAWRTHPFSLTSCSMVSFHPQKKCDDVYPARMKR
jgi:hypothetical protein